MVVPPPYYPRPLWVRPSWPDVGHGWRADWAFQESKARPDKACRGQIIVPQAWIYEIVEKVCPPPPHLRGRRSTAHAWGGASYVAQGTGAVRSERGTRDRGSTDTAFFFFFFFGPPPPQRETSPSTAIHRILIKKIGDRGVGKEGKNGGGGLARAESLKFQLVI